LGNKKAESKKKKKEGVSDDYYVTDI